MSQLNRWNHEPVVVPQGDEFLASSSAFPGVFGEGETREEAIESFWLMVELIGELARAPDWPHDRSPYVEPWESVDGDDSFADDEDDPFADDQDDDFADDEDDEELPEEPGAG